MTMTKIKLTKMILMKMVLTKMILTKLLKLMLTILRDKEQEGDDEDNFGSKIYSYVDIDKVGVMPSCLVLTWVSKLHLYVVL